MNTKKLILAIGVVFVLALLATGFFRFSQQKIEEPQKPEKKAQWAQWARLKR